ncbi:preprotein translocase subunit SecG [Phenylobacterium deserti]|uniref:Protein-export membrane protein SecG n=1 Tax=Phenylobacterium deserti TaxID=1914756 RepID=A0A328ADV6_9CAUL|nr:preprotein translocase subunit SecG [Phenylobacterium deserti]RAK52962.1 preprotein translocase subunit SecG [Phenylobacterium deserti]
MLLNLLLVLEILVSLALVGVVLLQRSEGGALGMGGGPSGFMTARGAGDLLTRITWILGASFFVLALLLTIVAGRQSGASSVVDRLKIDPLDTNTLNQPVAPAPAPGGAAAPAGQAPLQAPTPTVRNPFLGDQPATGAAPAIAPSPAPAAPAQQ